MEGLIKEEKSITHRSVCLSAKFEEELNKIDMVVMRCHMERCKSITTYCIHQLGMHCLQ